jgi:hypothetical protein
MSELMGRSSPSCTKMYSAYRPISFESDMVRITPEQAIQNARTKFGFDKATHGNAWKVRRLDRPSEAYYLIELGARDAVVGIAIVDVDTGEVGVYAALPGLGVHMAVDAQMAIELANGEKGSQAELVWKPSSASKSPLYPFWEVRTTRGIKYVNQQRRVLDKLEPTRLGG